MTGQVVPANPAASVRGPTHVVRTGKTPVLQPAEARLLLDTIDTSTLSGLRDRALLGVMVYSIARVSAVVGMRVEDYYQQGKRWWLRLQEKGRKHHAVRTPAGVVYCLTGTSSTWLGWMTLDDRPFER